MDIRVLGRSRAFAGGGANGGAGGGAGAGPAVVEARRPRSLLAALALHVGSDVAADRLVDLVWDGRPPAGAHGTLHTYVSGLRRVLEPTLAPRERPSVLLTTDRGYRLALGRDAVDAARFGEEVRAHHRALAPLAGQLGGPAGRDAATWPDRAEVVAHLEALDAALGLWDGRPYDDLGDDPAVVAERTALEELRLTAEEDRVLALLALGDHATVIAATEQAVGQHRWRERAWALHAVALVRSGRQADALAALREVRGVLAEELGIDPGPELRAVEEAVLRQDPALQRRLPPEALRPTQLLQPLRPAPPTPATAAPAGGRAVEPAPGLPLPPVGRGPEVRALEGLLGQAEAGHPACALLVGEPGIGKTRLLDHVTSLAGPRGVAVATGRCSQDDGAPPLWPWVGVLRQLAALPAPSPSVPAALELVTDQAGTPAAADPQAAFRVWEAIAAAVADQARRGPLLLLLDDLHWADTASLRTLRHLLDTAPDVGLAVVATRRPHPEPVGALAEVGEALARRHVARLDLTGLPAEEAAALVDRVAGHGVPPGTVARWQDRAGGNPFFLIELARLGGGPGPGGGRGADTEAVPATVRDVLLRRLRDLPEPTRELLVLAAVLGREFSLDVLAVVAELSPDAVDGRLDAARAVGLLRDLDAGTAGFAHALTRDAVAGSVPPTRLARLHARAAQAYEAGALGELVRPEERTSELARHWLAAGPAHTGRAWRAAAAAAEQERRAFSHEDAAALMAAAVAAHRRDPSGTPEQRHALLLTRAGDCQRAADWYAVVDCAREAVALARTAHDPERLTAAAAEMTRNGLWLPHDWGVVNEDVVEDLRWALEVLPTADSTARCQAMLTLAVELYYAPGTQAERAALVEEGLALARRLGDPGLLWWATRAAWLASWVPSRLAERTALGLEGLAVAEALGDPDRLALSHAVVACDALERGDRDGWEQHGSAADRIARRRRLAFVSYVLGFVEVTLAGMRGDLTAAQAGAARLRELRHQIHLPAEDAHEPGLALATGFWSPEVLAPYVGPMAAHYDADEDGVGLVVLPTALVRVGQVEEARSRLRSRPIDVGDEHWGWSMDVSLLGELAAAFRDPVLARQVRDHLAPLAGRMALSGFSVSVGPVDGYLALAEAVLAADGSGRPAAASAYADAAERLAGVWDFPLYVRWLRGQREALGF